jgi:hypothetical protein
VDRKTLLEGTTFRGIPLLYAVLFRIKDHEDLVSTMQQHMSRSYIGFDALSGMFGETQQILRRRANPSERDKLQEERVTCPFIGDTDVDISHRWSPPISLDNNLGGYL